MPATPICRPRLLGRAARAGASRYRRDRDLSRILPRLVGMRTAEVVRALSTAEEDCETARRTGDARYSFARHVGLLAALIAERRKAATAAA